MRLRDLAVMVLLAGVGGGIAYADGRDSQWSSPYRDDRGRHGDRDRGRDDDRGRDNDRDRDRGERQERRISLNEAVAMVKRNNKNAKVVRADEVQEGGRIVYKMRLVSSDNRVWMVTVDAATGSIR